MPATATVVLLAMMGLTQAQSSEQQSRENLPQSPSAFGGHVGRTMADSTEAWAPPVVAPAHAPNVLLIMTDDVGFAASSTFGGPIPTPNLDRLAAHGLKYNEFHTTALCSPSRAALLTGRNPHAVGTGMVVDTAQGFPGYSGAIPRSAATIGEVLKDNGFNTAWFGKDHNTPPWENSAAGPFDHWPTGLGFEYFYGFVAADTDQWSPKLYRNTTTVEDRTHDSGQMLDRELADDAIHWIHEQKAAAPDKPFFIYYAPGSGHAPQQAPPDWIAKFRGKFDQGWDNLRNDSFTRQKKLGVIPANAVLTPRPAELPDWNSLTAEQKRIDSRYMEVYAGVIAYQDAQVGRILDELQRMGQIDNTLVIFIEGDNGASGEGGPFGATNEFAVMANGVTSDSAPPAGLADRLGGPHSYEVYPAGWAWALNTPFQWLKQIASHLGGTRNGMVISWPDRIKDVGQLRAQFSYLTDIAPTIFEAVGVPAPAVVNGVPQQPLDGVGLVYTFDQPHASTRHTTQYFEMYGNRGIYLNGWLANTTPRRMPWQFASVSGNAFTDYKWELYDLRQDYSQSHNLAASMPDRLKTMQALWVREAERNNVFPLNDNSSMSRSLFSPQAHAARRTHYVYWGQDISIAEMAAPSFAARSFSIGVDIVVPRPNLTGVIIARGSWFGGWSFYLKDGKPVAYEAFSERRQDHFRVDSEVAVPTGPAKLQYDFTYDGGGLGKGGLMRISVNGVKVAEGRIDRTILAPAGGGETFDIGQDTGAPVSEDYNAWARFGGEISKVEIDLGPITLSLDGAAASAKAWADEHSE